MEEIGTRATFLVEHDGQKKRATTDRIIVLKKMKMTKGVCNSGDGRGSSGAGTSGSKLSTQRQISDSPVGAGQAGGEQGEHGGSEQEV